MKKIPSSITPVAPREPTHVERLTKELIETKAEVEKLKSLCQQLEITVRTQSKLINML